MVSNRSKSASKCDRAKAVARLKRIVFNLCDAVGNVDGLKATATPKRSLSNAFETIRQSNRRKAEARVECPLSYGSYAVGNIDGSKS